MELLVPQDCHGDPAVREVDDDGGLCLLVEPTYSVDVLHSGVQLGDGLELTFVLSCGEHGLDDITYPFRQGLVGLRSRVGLYRGDGDSEESEIYLWLAGPCC